MGKKKQKKRKRTTSSDGNDRTNEEPGSNSLVEARETPIKMENPLLDGQRSFMEQKGLTDTERHEFFSPSISSDRRAELWMAQADLGEDLVNQYAWATPSSTAIRIIKEFSPLVEIGCGSNAYWCKILRGAGVDIVGYDVNIASGGLIEGKSQRKKRKISKSHPSYLKQGGPDALSSKEIQESGRTLFLCYPDEHEDVATGPPLQKDHRQHDDEDEGIPTLPMSMGWQSLHHYSGEYVIHVGETFLDANFSMEQAPWGRSSSPEFQQRLSSEFHCLLKVELPNWLHTRDSLTVWKRSTISKFVFVADEDESGQEDDDEVEYRHIPRNERLPMNLAAPCLEHLLLPNEKLPPTSSNALLSETPLPNEKHLVSTSQKPRKSVAQSISETPVPQKTTSGDAIVSKRSISQKKKKERNKRHRENGKATGPENALLSTPKIQKNSDAGYKWSDLDDALAQGDDGKFGSRW